MEGIHKAIELGYSPVKVRAGHCFCPSSRLSFPCRSRHHFPTHRVQPCPSQRKGGQHCDPHGLPQPEESCGVKGKDRDLHWRAEAGPRSPKVTPAKTAPRDSAHGPFIPGR